MALAPPSQKKINKTNKKRVRRKRGKTNAGGIGGGGAVPLLRMLWWNTRGVLSKEEILKEYLNKEGAATCGVSESHTYKSGEALSDRRWRWDAGPEGKPNAKGGGPSKGVGTFIDITKIKGSIIDTGKYTLWHRIELEGCKAMVMGTGTSHKPTT